MRDASSAVKWHFFSWNTPIVIFHSLFKNYTEYFMQIFKVWNAGEHTRVTPNVFLHLFCFWVFRSRVTFTGSQKRVIGTKNQSFFVSTVLCLLPNPQINPNNLPKCMKWTFDLWPVFRWNIRSVGVRETQYLVIWTRNWDFPEMLTLV